MPEIPALTARARATAYRPTTARKTNAAVALDRNRTRRRIDGCLTEAVPRRRRLAIDGRSSRPADSRSAGPRCVAPHSFRGRPVLPPGNAVRSPSVKPPHAARTIVPRSGRTICLFPFRSDRVGCFVWLEPPSCVSRCAVSNAACGSSCSPQSN